MSGSIVGAIDAVGYVAAGWIVVVGSIAGFAVATVRREKRLAASVAPEERRWS